MLRIQMSVEYLHGIPGYENAPLDEVVLYV